MSNNLSFKTDYSLGKKNEDKVFTLICKYWSDRNIIKSNDVVSNYDFYDTKYKYELKSRRCSSDTYSTTLIPEMKCHKKTYLLFLFTDGLYYIRYRKCVFEEFEKKLFVKNRNDKDDVQKNYFYIQIDKLKKIELDDMQTKKIDYKVYLD